MADRSTSDAGIPETAERKAPAVSSEALEVDTARDLGPSVDAATHEPAEKNASNQLQVVSRVDDAELDTDSSASSLYEYVSDADVEAVGESGFLTG